MYSLILLATVLNAVIVQALGIPHFFTAASIKRLTTRSEAPRQLLVWPEPALNQTVVIQKRQRDDNRCGRNNDGASCAQDECCSAEGWCGKGLFYCSAPACQINFGPACDANKRPRGANTENTPRPHRGSVPYGRGIFGCEKSGVVALTFDDGPYNYTEHILDLLHDYNAVATFFVTGHNLGKGAINDGSYPWRSLIQRMLREGHQIGSHTWGHQRLTELTKPQLRRQMIYNEIAIADIIGKFPTYMRPPYSASSDTVDSWLGDMGYHVTYFNLDTEGYLHNEAGEIQQSKSIWDSSVEGKTPSSIRYLQIEHDIVYQAAYNLTEYFLQSLQRNNLKSATVGECLNDPPENWYRFPSGSGSGSGSGGGGDNDGGDVRDDKSGGKPPTMPATTDGRCGPNQGGQTCYYEKGATCCSRRGWCGKTGDHCGGGCQPVYGTCGWSN